MGRQKDVDHKRRPQLRWRAQLGTWVGRWSPASRKHRRRPKTRNRKAADERRGQQYRPPTNGGMGITDQGTSDRPGPEGTGM